MMTIDFLLGKHLIMDGLLQRQRFRAFKLMALIGVIGCIIITIQFAKLFPNAAFLNRCSATLAGIFFINYISFLFHKKHLVAYFIPILATTLILHASLIYTGGILNPGMFYLAPIIVCSFFLLGSRLGFIAVAIALFELVYFYNFDEVKYRLPNTYQFYKIDALITISVATTILVAFAYIIESTKNISIEEAEHSNKKLQKYTSEIEKLSIATSKTDNSIIITDENGYIEWVNEGFEKQTGYDLMDVKGTYGEILRAGGSTSLSDKNIVQQCIDERKSIMYTERNYKKNGQEYWVSTTLTPIFDEKNKFKNLIAIDTDITERKQIENELLVAMNIAEESVKNQRTLMNTLSTEIKMPLFGITSLTDNLLALNLSEEQEAIVRTIRMSTRTLELTMDDVLAFTKLPDRKAILNLEAFNLYNFASHTVFQNKFLAIEKQIQLFTAFNIDKNLFIEGDKAVLTQIANTFIQSALEYSEYGQLTIEVETKERNNVVDTTFKIKNIGKGIPANKIAEFCAMFEKEYTPNAFENITKENGIEISKKLLALMGGNVGCEQESENNALNIWFKFKGKTV